MGKDNLLLLGVGAIAVYALFAKKSDGSPLLQLDNILAPSPDNPNDGAADWLSGYTEGMNFGIGSMSDFMNNLFATSPAQDGGLFGWDGSLPDWWNTSPNPTQGGGSQNYGLWDFPLVNPSGSTIIDASNALSNTLASVAKGSVLLGGTYLAMKGLPPILTAIAPPIASALSSGVSGAAAGAGRVVGALGTMAPSLTAPVSLSVGTVGAVAATGVASYAATTWALNNTSVGKTIKGYSEASGTWAANTAAGKWFKSNILGQNLGSGNAARIDTSKTVGTQNFSMSQIRSLLDKGYSPAQISAMANA